MILTGLLGELSNINKDINIKLPFDDMATPNNHNLMIRTKYH